MMWWFPQLLLFASCLAPFESATVRQVEGKALVQGHISPSRVGVEEVWVRAPRESPSARGAGTAFRFCGLGVGAIS